MVGWHHQLNGHEFEETPGDSEGQESLVLQSMGSQGSDTSEQLNNNTWRHRSFNLAALVTEWSLLSRNSSLPSNGQHGTMDQEV